MKTAQNCSQWICWSPHTLQLHDWVCVCQHYKHTEDALHCGHTGIMKVMNTGKTGKDIFDASFITWWLNHTPSTLIFLWDLFCLWRYQEPHYMILMLMTSLPKSSSQKKKKKTKWDAAAALIKWKQTFHLVVRVEHSYSCLVTVLN